MVVTDHWSVDLWMLPGAPCALVLLVKQGARRAGQVTVTSICSNAPLSATTSPVTRRRLIPGRLDRVQRCSLGEACDGCGALWLLVEHFVEQPPVELLALIRPRIMELVRLPCPATRIHQPDNSGHVTVGINWTAPQIEFWAKKEEQQNKKEMKHKMLESHFIMI